MAALFAVVIDLESDSDSDATDVAMAGDAVALASDDASDDESDDASDDASDGESDGEGSDKWYMAAADTHLEKVMERLQAPGMTFAKLCGLL
jgi:hypothetical protein